MSKKKTNIAELLAKKIDKNVNTLVNKLSSKVIVQSNDEVDSTSNTDHTTTPQTDFTDSIKLPTNKNKSSSNLQSIASVVKTLKNDANLLSFSDSDVANFCSTFCKVILDANVNVVIDTPTKALHKSVLEYFRDGETNSTIQNLSLILGTSVSYSEIKTASSLCSCTGMNNYLSENNNGLSCLNIYKLSMYQHLINMLGDIEFYKIWFFTINTPPVARKNMVNNLKLLIDLLLASNYNLSLQEDDFYCTVNYSKDEAYKANKKIIENYKMILDIVISDCGLSKNKNKIKLYGQEFGKLLPKLKF